MSVSLKRNGGLRRGAWTHEEDGLLKRCIEKYGEGNWHMVPVRAGLARCRKSCRLRWLNYLKPGLKRGEFGEDEIDLILRLHYLLGNRWALIAGRIPGRTANDNKNYWNSHLSRKLKSMASAAPASQSSHGVYGSINAYESSKTISSKVDRKRKKMSETTTSAGNKKKKISSGTKETKKTTTKEKKNTQTFQELSRGENIIVSHKP